jgi:hypothetical protein
VEIGKNQSIDHSYESRKSPKTCKLGTKRYNHQRSMLDEEQILKHIYFTPQSANARIEQICKNISSRTSNSINISTL